MSFRGILLKLWRRRRLEHDLEAELAFHRALAREQANPIELGNVTRIQEESRDLWRLTRLEDFWRDVVYAVRSLWRTPGFAATAILTLALGIGANTAIFTLIHRVMLAPLPVQQPEQLIELLTDRGGPAPGTAFSYQALQDFRTHTRVCSTIIGFSNVTFHTLIDGNTMERLNGQFVTGDYFSALGVSTVRGRPIRPEDDRTGAANAVAVISHGMWQDRFGGDSGAIGKTLVLESVPYTIVGITPAGFQGLEVGRQNDIWVPLESERGIRRPSYTSDPGYKWLLLVGRLKPGEPIERANAELGLLFKRAVSENEIAVLQADPRFDQALAGRIRSWSLLLEPAGNGLSRTRDQYSAPLLVLMTIVGVLLLIACTNVANLLFVRGLAREKEIALRLSLGAGRFRLIRQLLTESVVLVVAGGAFGLVIAYLLSRYLMSFVATSNPPLVLDVSPNAATLSFTAVVAILTVVVFGLVPAFRSTDTDFATKLKGSPRGWVRGKSHRWTGGLIVVQVALLSVLVLGGGLFVRTLHNLNSIDLGFDRSNVLLSIVDPFGSGHSQEQLRSLSEELLERIEALPGVRSASLTRFAPISGGTGANRMFVINRKGAGQTEARNVFVNNVSQNYFATLGIAVIAGREFDARDSNAARPVVIVNQAFAGRYFGNESPIGKIILQRDTPMEIVGVAANAKYSDIRETVEPTVYQNAFQQFGVPLQLLIRTDRNPETLAAAVRAEVKSVIGTVAIRERTLKEHIEATLVRERLVTTLATLFGSLAFVLAVIGLYGVVSNSVARRTKEIGIRMALGFDGRSAIAMVLREVLALVGTGVLLGVPLALVVARSIASLLYGLAPNDPLTVLASIGSLLLAGLVAGFIPARRASRIDPMVALRVD